MKQRAQARKQRAQARKKGETPQTGRKQLESWGKQRVTIGLDLGDRKSKYCVFNGDSYLKEADVPTTPEEMKVVFGAMKPCRIAMEVGTHSPWVSAMFKELGYEVYVANAREVRANSQSQKKNDKLDARKLARLARVDPELLSPIRQRSVKARRHTC